MVADLTQLNEIFKESYIDGTDVFKAQQNISAPFWAKVKKSNAKMSPDGTFNSVTMSYDYSGGALNENGTFDDYEGDNPAKPKIVAKLNTYPIEISGSTIRLSETDKTAFGKAMDYVMKNRLAVAMYDHERMLFGTGTGQMSLANGTGSAVTALIVDDTTPFRENMYIESFATIGGAKEIGVTTAAKITAINLATKTLTLSSPQTWSDNSIICRKGKMDGVTSLANAKEILGIQGLVDVSTFSTTFEGLSTTTFPQFTGNVVSAGSAPISHDFLQRLMNRAPIACGEEPDLLVSNYGQARNFLNTELQKTRYEPGEVKAGATVLKWGKFEWMVSYNCPQGMVFMLNMNNIEKYEAKALGMSDLPGQSLYQIQNKDAIGGYFVSQLNIGTWGRNRHCKGTDLTEPTY